MRNENKVDEMVAILDELHQYVPTTRSSMEVFVPTETEADIIEVDNFHKKKILLGGDQLTVVRSCSAGNAYSELNLVVKAEQCDSCSY